MIVKVVKAKVCFYEVLGEGDKLNLVQKSEIISGVTPNEKAVAKYFAKLGPRCSGDGCGEDRRKIQHFGR